MLCSLVDVFCNSFVTHKLCFWNTLDSLINPFTRKYKTSDNGIVNTCDEVPVPSFGDKVTISFPTKSQNYNHKTMRFVI